MPGRYRRPRAWADRQGRECTGGPNPQAYSGHCTRVVGGRRGFVIYPQGRCPNATAGHPWVWYAPTFVNDTEHGGGVWTAPDRAGGMAGQHAPKECAERAAGRRHRELGNGSSG